MNSPLPSVRISVRDIAVFGLLGAFMLIGQVALAFLPNIEPVSLLVILYIVVFGPKALLSIYTFVLLEGVFYGFHLWWISYLYVWTLLAVVAHIFRHKRHPLLWAVISGLFGLLFGALCAIPYLFIGGPSMALAYWVSGIPFDLLHCAGNFAAALILFKPLFYILNRLKKSVSME